MPTHRLSTVQRVMPPLTTATVLLPTLARHELKLRMVPGLAVMDPPVVGPKDGVKVSTTASVLPSKEELISLEQGDV